MSLNMHRIALRSVLGLMLLFFFLPFVSLSCGNKKLTTLNGLQMAMGTTWEEKGPLGLSLKQDTTPPEPLAIMVGVAALAAVALALVKGKRKKAGAGIASAVCVVLLLIMKAKVEREILAQTHNAVAVQWEFGFWLMLLAALAGAFVAFLPMSRNSD
jgi:hypothetical protein